MDCNEDHIVKLLDQVGPLCPIEALCDEVEKRGRLKLCLSWLEARQNEGVQEPALHNALAKVYLDTNKDAQRFLETNPVSSMFMDLFISLAFMFCLYRNFNE